MPTQSLPSDDDLLDKYDTARMLKQHPATVLAKARTGELPCVRFGPQTVRFRKADVLAYIERHAVESKP